jgi:hypothetical protein
MAQNTLSLNPRRTNSREARTGDFHEQGSGGVRERNRGGGFSVTACPVVEADGDVSEKARELLPNTTRAEKAEL